MQPVILPKKDDSEEINHKNIVNFLMCYKKTSDLSSINPDILKNAKVFSEESKLPELWIRTKTPFNKNNAFTDFKHQLEDKRAYPGGMMKRPIPNFFPKNPFTLPDSCELVQSTRKNIVLKPSPPQPKSNYILNHKSWMISLIKEGKTVEFGPYSSEKIKTFLNFPYRKLSEEDKKERGIMIIDLENDVHYLPETLLEIFQIDKDRPDLLEWDQESLFDKIEEEKYDKMWKGQTPKEMVLNIFN